ncbi:MAG: DUF411 domain-containing protein [Candidatus Promineifilaceae bacterium]|nr:DUF411 domain-containing protein [Candidatus Promineifilaceae bacterium]
MIKKLILLVFLAVVVLAACAPEAAPADPPVVGEMPVDETIVVYSSPLCSCCGGWIDYMRDNGYTLEVESIENLAPIKAQYGVPQRLQSCHTAVVGGYVVEGHVPADAVARLLNERPDVAGIAVPAMPIGSPGMEVEGVEAQPYDVLAFDASGNSEVFASYNQ